MIRSVILPARRLLTLGEDREIWTLPNNRTSDLILDMSGLRVAAGALVRLHPPAGISEQDIAAVVARLEEAGAARVKVVPRASSPEVVRRIDVDPSLPRRSHREAVFAAADEARSSDPAALRALLGDILDEEGI